MPDFGQLWTSIVSNPLIQLSVRLAGLYILAIYLAMVFWTVRDAQQRTENQLLPYLAGLMVVILNIFGLFLYLIVRPKETLGEAYERQLAEDMPHAMHAADDPVLAALWDNDADAVYDDL